MSMSPFVPLELDIPGPDAPLKITWEDGHQSVYPLEHLRRWCPCAHCTDHGLTPLEVRLRRPLPDAAFRVKQIEEVGNYALFIRWGDGHDSGIYSFQHLRYVCACATCLPTESWEV